MFSLQEAEISPPAQNNRSAGGFVSFEGRVRDINHGKNVIRLEYEAFSELAVAEGGRILCEARQRFDILDIQAIHRTGNVSIGERAVWVGAVTEHRDAAFQACRYVIDEIKHRLPIWKKETYADGSAEWVACHHENHHSEQHRNSDEASSSQLSMEELQVYAKQLLLPEIDVAGQQALKQARVLVVGSGGLGTPALTYLARAGVGTLGICEFDFVAPDNLPRQILYRYADIGKQKIEQAKAQLLEIAPWVQVRLHAEPFIVENAKTLLQQYDLVLDCTDNARTHLLLSGMAVLYKTPLVQASVYQYEGQLAVYHPAESPCLCGLWIDAPSQGVSCTEHGVLNTTPGLLGVLQATEAIKLLLELTSPLRTHSLLLDVLDYRMLKIQRAVKPRCEICDPSKQGTEPFPQQQSECLITEISLPNLDALAQYDVIFVAGAQIDMQAFGIPLKKRWQVWDNAWKPDPGNDNNYLLVCPFGRRSLSLSEALREQGFRNVFSLQGGIFSLKQLLSQKEALV